MPPSVRHARWVHAKPQAETVACLVREAGLSPLLAALLANRGLTTPAAAATYLGGSLDDLHDPFLMAGMKPAVDLLQSALAAGEHIRVWGDYDVDGVSGTALLVRALGALGGNVSHYLPHRVNEGYGLNREAIKRCARDGVRLLVTVDCGIGAPEEVALARRLGMRVIVTDHHLPPEVLPKAEAVVNPRQPGCAYPWPDLCGAGVAFKLLDALCRARGLPPRSAHRFLDLVALATVADVVPLQGENRLLVKAGLPALAGTRKEGLRALMAAAGIAPERLDTYHLGFALGPRLNAAGRLHHAEDALRLLLTGDPEEAKTLAGALDESNRRRQEEERRILGQAQEAVESGEVDCRWAIVLADRRWHPGVVGIVASRLAERYYRPTLLVSLQGEEGRGSGRSIPGFHLHEALWECRDLFSHFGGHAAAAGFSLDAGRVDELRERFSAVAASRLKAEDLTPLLQVDAWPEPAALTLETAREIARMAPFGTGNPAPLVGLRGVTLAECRRVGDGTHLRLRLRAGEWEQAAIWFGFGYLADVLPPGAVVDLLCEPSLDTWNGSERLNLQVADLRADRELPAKP